PNLTITCLPLPIVLVPEKRAKEADALRRQVARNAREEIKRSSQMIINDDLAITVPSAGDTAPPDQVRVHVLGTNNGTAKVLVSPPVSNADSPEIRKGAIPLGETNGSTTVRSIDTSPQTAPSQKPNSDVTSSEPLLKQVLTSQKPAFPSPKPALMPKPCVKPPVPPKASVIKPITAFQGPPQQATSRSRDAKVFERTEVEAWFAAEQLNAGAVSENSRPGETADWFHGFLSRADAESILNPRVEGSFLVRVHDRIKGYVVSYRAAEKVKHFLVDASQPGHVQFFGANQIIFKSIVHLVNFHMAQPVSMVGSELLRVGVPLTVTLNSNCEFENGVPQDGIRL
ncbi:SH2 domain-containing protein 4A-like, partial [Tropilaelaps mercedesae]